MKLPFTEVPYPFASPTFIGAVDLEVADFWGDEVEIFDFIQVQRSFTKWAEDWESIEAIVIYIKALFTENVSAVVEDGVNVYTLAERAHVLL